MTFNSLAFLCFLPIVFMLYWLLQSNGTRWQNCFILFASYVFYGWWDWRYLGLVALSTVVDFSIGLWLQKEENPQKRHNILLISLFLNLGLLFFFKYFNFFADSFADFMLGFGWEVNDVTLKIILPVGISFYTFQNLSYTVDVYRKKLTATHDFWAFAAFVTFFPQLVAGPIERAANLLPQFLQKRIFDSNAASIGCRLILWGLLKKIVLADNLDTIVRQVFGVPNTQNAWTVMLGATCFAVQIYGDFSGYSDIARGCARLFGFDLMQNFRIPYHSTSLKTFWQRWHISLSGWFRDYVYVPLGGNRGNRWLLIRNLIFTFALSGLWHGANWTYLIWGLWHGVLLAIETLWIKNKITPKSTNYFLKTCQHLWVLTVVCIGWVFFRANNMGDAWALLSCLGRFSGGFKTLAEVFSPEKYAALLLITAFVFSIEKHSNGSPEILPSFLPTSLRWGIYFFLTGLILLLGAFNTAPVFIYFQF
jgi:alginate O-acetyltransferase complex protein AlgI